MKIEDQPPPTARPDRVAIWDLVIADVQGLADVQQVYASEDDRFIDHVKAVDAAILADMRDRDRIGRERYGTPLTAHNGRDQLVDAYQEALDMAVYLRAALEEKPDGLITILYTDHLSTTLRLRAAIMVRDNPPTFGKPEIVTRECGCGAAIAVNGICKRCGGLVSG